MQTTGWHRSGPRMLALTGCGLVFVSAFLPWVDARATNNSYSVLPGANGYIGFPVWLVLITVAAGGALLLTRDSTSLLSAGAMLWTLTSIVAWSVGSKFASLIPNRIVPGNAEIQTSIGIGLGLAGGLMIVIGCIGVLVEQTWPAARREHAPWITPVGALLGVGLLAVRDVAWLEIKTSRFDWKLRVDAVPFFGDVLVLFLLFGAIFALWLSTFPRPWVSILCGLSGLFVSLLSVTALVAQGWATRISGWMIDSLEVDGALGPPVRSRLGPVSMLVCGLLLLAYSAAVFLVHVGSNETVERRVIAEPTLGMGKDPLAPRINQKDPFG